MTTEQINRNFYFRIRRFNGYSKTGRIKYTKRKSVRAAYLIKMFGYDKLQWWINKAMDSDKPFSFTKKEHYRIDLYCNRSGK